MCVYVIMLIFLCILCYYVYSVKSFWELVFIVIQKPNSNKVFLSYLIKSVNGDHSPNFLRQTSLLFHKWLAERFYLDDAWIVNVRYKNTSIYNALITWIEKFCTFRSQTKLFSRLFFYIINYNIIVQVRKTIMKQKKLPVLRDIQYGSLLFIW